MCLKTDWIWPWFSWGVRVRVRHLIDHEMIFKVSSNLVILGILWILWTGIVERAAPYKLMWLPVNLPAPKSQSQPNSWAPRHQERFQSEQAQPKRSDFGPAGTESISHPALHLKNPGRGARGGILRMKAAVYSSAIASRSPPLSRGAHTVMLELHCCRRKAPAGRAAHGATESGEGWILGEEHRVSHTLLGWAWKALHKQWQLPQSLAAFPASSLPSLPVPRAPQVGALGNGSFSNSWGKNPKKPKPKQEKRTAV